MAKNKRFPSDANKPIPTKESLERGDLGAVAGAAPAESKEKIVHGVSQKLVQVEYKKDNHHVLGSVSSVHALRKGVNHLPEHVWLEAKEHPSVKALLKSGDLVDLGDAVEEKEEESEDESEAESEGASPSDGEDKPAA